MYEFLKTSPDVSREDIVRTLKKSMLVCEETISNCSWEIRALELMIDLCETLYKSAYSSADMRVTIEYGKLNKKCQEDCKALWEERKSQIEADLKYWEGKKDEQ
jgi:hypothetical protein